LHTVILSDMHLSEAQRPDPKRPLWMAYKRREFFIDEDFARLIDHLMQSGVEGPIELVLNGDIFDFDNIMQRPDNPAGRVSWLAKARGLPSEEWASLFKLDCIIRDHPVWMAALTDFLRQGHRVVFVIGNHDAELHWPSVQQRLCDALGVPSPPPLSLRPPAGEAGGSAAEPSQVEFCSWFYLSNQDTYISHGHQYDPNCVIKDPIHPLISIRGAARVRIPFGDLAGRYMLNGMGYFNPNATSNFIMSAWQYARFFFRYMLRTQPLLIWSWFWSALATLIISLRDHWRPALKDPLVLEEKVRAIARRANATPAMVRRLHALSVPSACSRPLALIRELWLDRGLLFLAVLYAAWQVVLLINIALPLSPLWVFVPLALLLLPYIAYASSVKSSVFVEPLLNERLADLIHKITGARRIVFGHTHEPEQRQIGPVAFYNGGAWSLSFAEPECRTRIGTQTFVWIRPSESGERSAYLYEWPATGGPRLYQQPQPAQLGRPSIHPTPEIAQGGAS